MSQYSISLKSIINIKSHFDNDDDVFANTKLKIKRGREIFFDFDYDGDDEFKELFENKFMINYLRESIYCDDADLFILALENEVKIKAPIFYNKYKAIQELKNADLALGDRTVTNRDGSDTKTNNGSSSNTASAQTSGSTSESGKTKTSQFPQDIVSSGSFSSIDYMDAGTASDNSGSSSGTSSSTSRTTNSDNSDGSFVEHTETIHTVNPFDRIEKYMELQLDVISDFVLSFRNLFMRIW